MKPPSVKLPTDMHLPSPDRDLLKAATSGDLDQVKAALAAGGDIEACTPAAETALLCAALNNPRREVSAFLVDQGAQLQVTNGAGESVLHSFAHYGWSDLVEKALDAGCQVDAPDGVLQSPLALAAAGSTQEHLEVVKMLLRRGGSPFGTLLSGATCLNIDSVPLLEAALEAGLDVNARSKDGVTMLMLIFDNDNVELCGALIANGANIDAVDDSGMPAMAFAVGAGAAKSFALLLAVGAKTDFVTKHGETLDSMMQAANDSVRQTYFSWCARQVMKRTVAQIAAAKP